MPAMYVILPALEITDWPDVPQRAVAWSFQKPFRSTHVSLRALVPLLSKLRLSHLILDVDTMDSSAPSTQETHAGAAKQMVTLTS
jgi:hypothetical protein